jgi:raffinose/stachyose/melibiose transport system substrate-binding protein
VTASAAPRRTPPRWTGLAACGLLLTGCSVGEAQQPTTITFFQFKGEAVAYFEDLAQQFEEQNPDVRVVVDNVPDPETALRTRLVKEDVPDVMTLNANGTFGELASAGIFADFAGTSVLEDVNPAYVDVVHKLGAAAPGEVNGVPFAANASAVIYNEELFAEHGVTVPQTWDELIAVAQTFEDAGVTPFQGMLADAWTGQAPLAPIVPQTTPEDFWEERFAGGTTFREEWPEAVEKLATLFEHTQPDPVASGYEDGTAAFARGESAMVVLGSYALPQIRSFEPDFPISTFALPATNDPAATTVVSGVDVVVTAAAETEHPEEVRRFIDFLMQPEVVQAYAEEQVAIPTLEGMTNDDPALSGIQPYIEQERLVGFFDHQFIPAVPLGALLQQYLIDGDQDAFLGQLDESWDKVAARRTWGLGAVEPR